MKKKIFESTICRTLSHFSRNCPISPGIAGSLTIKVLYRKMRKNRQGYDAQTIQYNFIFETAIGMKRTPLKETARRMGFPCWQGDGNYAETGMLYEFGPHGS